MSHRPTVLPRAIRRGCAWACLALTVCLNLRGAAPAHAQGALPEGYRQIGYWTNRPPKAEVPVFERPAGVDVATDDTIYVVDRSSNLIYHLDNRGRTLASVGDPQIGALKDVAVSAQRVYVLGTTGGAMYSRDLKNRTVWGVTGEGLTFDAVRNQALVTRVVSGEARIQVYDASGISLGSWRDENFSIGTAFDLDVGPDGRIYMAGDGSIYVFTVGGASGVTASALLRMPRNLEGAAELRSVAVDGSGRVFTAVTSTAGYYLGWDNAGKLLAGAPLQTSGLAGAASLAAGPGAGMVFSVNQGSGYKGLSYQADRVDFKTEPLRWGGSADATLGLLQSPRRLAVGSGEDAFILDQRSRSQLWTPAGEARQQWTYSDDDYPGDVGGGGPFPCRITGLKVACHDPAGDWTVKIPDSGWLTAVDGDATRVAALDLADQKVWVYNRTGQAQANWALEPAGSFVSIGDLAMEAGRIYLADQTNLRIDVRNAADGARLAQIPMPAGPMKLDVSAGMVYVLAKDNRVWKYVAADGSLRAVFNLDGVTAPNDLAAAPFGRVYIADPLRDQILLYEPGGTPMAAPPVEGVGCKVLLGKTAAPDPVERFQLATVQLRVSGACPLGDGRLDVVLIIDESGSMSGSTIAAAQNAALAFLGELNPKGVQISVVSFDTSATVLQPLTNDLRGVVRAVGRLSAGGQTNYVDALEKGRQELVGPASRPGVPRVAVMMTDGKPTSTDGLDDAAAALKATGATVYTIGLGTTINDDILKNTVSSRRDLYYAAPTDAQLALVYRNIARSLSAARLLAGGTVVDELPADMRYEPGSAFPPPDTIQGRTLTWTLGEVPASGRTLSYKVRPQREGRHPTNVQASLTYQDAAGESGQAVFPIPEITVLRARNLLLPVVYRNSCKQQRADIVLAIDTSGSMLEASQSGSSQTKLQAAIAAGQSFLNNMSFPEDQAAVVSFNETARVVVPLSSSRAALSFALNGLTTKTGTRIDRGIETSMAELLSGRTRKGHKPVIILLTDGRPTAGTEAEALKDAASARGMGFSVFTIGLGPDLDKVLLTQIAGKAGQAFFAPDGSALKRIYDQVAGKALCD
ncbi:MAG: VWA domain-containing protein [Anaerolineae bacterium]